MFQSFPHQSIPLESIPMAPTPMQRLQSMALLALATGPSSYETFSRRASRRAIRAYRAAVRKAPEGFNLRFDRRGRVMADDRRFFGIPE